MAGRGQGLEVGKLGSIRSDGSRLPIHPSDVKGRFIRWRRVTFYLLIAFYVLLPLWRIKGHPAVHLDVEGRRFYLFGSTFNAQDFWIALFIVTTLGFALLFVTVWLGRVWCGWACPQTVFLEGVYRRIERWIDGPRERRLRNARGPSTTGQSVRSIVKHALYVLVSLGLAHVALAFFTTAPGLVGMIREGPFAHEAAFGWTVAVSGALYFNFAWFREQLCIMVCPYGRMQSAMVDRDSLIIGYDPGRGEPRGRLVKAALERSTLGDCVDCNKCVTACPTGIDIRNGLQLECIACAQCIDACDEVMAKVGRPQGLIRYDSLHGLAGEKKRLGRPRLYAYGAALLASATALVLALALRTPFEANLFRAKGLPFVLDDAQVRNQFELHLVNKNPVASTFDIRVLGDGKVKAVIPQPHVELGSLEDLRLPIFLTVERAQFQADLPVQVEVVDHVSGAAKRVEARFLGPQG